jgi:hypothetical protein
MTRLSDFCKHRHLSGDAPGLVRTRRSLGTMGQAVQSALLPSLLPSPRGTDLSSMECNAWTSREHHKSEPPAHRAIRWVRGRVSNRRLCTSAEAAATARGPAHPNLKQRRPAEQNSRVPQFQADNPNRSHLSILAPRKSRVPSTSRSPVDHRASLSTAWSFVMSAVTSSRCTETTPGYDSVMRQLVLQPHRTRKRIGHTTLTATLHPVERIRFSLQWVR